MVRAEQRVGEALVELEPVADASRRGVEAEHVGERESLARRTTVLPVQDGDRERAAAQRAPVHLERAVVAVVLLLAAALRQFVNPQRYKTQLYASLFLSVDQSARDIPELINLLVWRVLYLLLLLRISPSKRDHRPRRAGHPEWRRCACW